jgi:hypothetical protein
MARRARLAAMICIAAAAPSSAFLHPSNPWLKSPRLVVQRSCNAFPSHGLLAASMSARAGFMARQVGDLSVNNVFSNNGNICFDAGFFEGCELRMTVR